MNIHPLTVLALVFASGLAVAADAKHDDHGSGHDAHAAPAKAEAAKAEPAKADASKADAAKPDAAKPDAAKPDAHAADAAEAKPAKKAKAKKPKASKHAAKGEPATTVDAHAPAHGKPATHAAGAAHDAGHDAGHDAPAAAGSAPAAPTAKRIRIKDRAAASAAVTTQADAHGTPAEAHGTAQSAPANDGHGAAAAAPAAAQADAHGDTHGDKQAAAPAAADHGSHGDAHAASAPAAAPDAARADAAHAAPAAAPAPAPVSRTARVSPKKSATAKPAPTALAPASDAHAPQAAADAHGDGHGDKHGDAQAQTQTQSAAPASGDAAGKDAHAGHDMHGDQGTAHAANASNTAPTPGTADAASLSPKSSAGTECDPPLKAEVAALFDRWNASLRTGDPRKVVANYAPNSVLLPTVSNRARYTVAEKEDYFMHFLQRRPEGRIDDRVIDVDCNSATDAGLYTFRFADGTSVKARYSFSYKKIDGQWLITSHHSSAMPEKAETAAADGHVQPAPAAAAQAKSVSDSGPAKGWVRFP